MLSFENNGLNLGETVLLQKEVNPMLDALRSRGIIVTAFHNHWLFEEPRLMYMHWEDVEMIVLSLLMKALKQQWKQDFLKSELFVMFLVNITNGFISTQFLIPLISPFSLIAIGKTLNKR